MQMENEHEKFEESEEVKTTNTRINDQGQRLGRRHVYLSGVHSDIDRYTTINLYGEMTISSHRRIVISAKKVVRLPSVGSPTLLKAY